jgi:hypothetical protein
MEAATDFDAIIGALKSEVGHWKVLTKEHPKLASARTLAKYDGRGRRVSRAFASSTCHGLPSGLAAVSVTVD